MSNESRKFHVRLGPDKMMLFLQNFSVLRSGLLAYQLSMSNPEQIFMLQSPHGHRGFLGIVRLSKQESVIIWQPC